MKSTITLIASIIPFILAGCFSLSKSPPEKGYFVIEAAREEKAPAPEGAPVIYFRSLEASPAFQGKGFVYRLGDLAYEADFYNEFFVSPNLLAAGETRWWLQDSGLFTHVTESAGRMEPDFHLKGAVKALYGDYRNTSSPKAVLELSFVLLSRGSGSTAVVMNRSYRKEVPMNRPVPEGLAKGWSLGLKEILQELENDLRHSVERSPAQ
jgi:hypothetical protein